MSQSGVHLRRFLLAAGLVGLLLLPGACGHVDRSRRVIVWEQMDPQEQLLFDKHVAEFRTRHPEFADFTIERVHYRVEDLPTQFQTAALAYGGPNLVYGPADKIGPFQIMGLLMPIEDICPGELPRFDPAALPVLDGRTWGLPDYVGNHLTLVANKALVDTVATNTDQWLRQLEAATLDKDGDGRTDQYGLVFNLLEPFWLVPWLGGYGGWVMDDHARPTLDSPAMVAALDFLSGLKERRVVPRECDYPLADTIFKEGRAAYIINGPWSWEGYRAAGIDIELACIPMVSATGLWPTPMTSAKCYSVNRYLDPATQGLHRRAAGLAHLHPGAGGAGPEAERAAQRPGGPPAAGAAHRSRDAGQFRADRQGAAHAHRAGDAGHLGRHAPRLPERHERRADAGRRRPRHAAAGRDHDREDARMSLARSRRRLAFWFLLPAALVLLGVVAYPFLYNVYVSLTNWNMYNFRAPQLVGFRHYGRIFLEPDFYRIFFKTFLWTAVNLVFHFILGLGAALLLNRRLPGRAVYRALLILPWAVPQYISALTWRGMFNVEFGAVNQLLGKLGIAPVAWFAHEWTAFSAAVITNIWLGFPFVMVIALGGLQSIPEEMYEAARIDGAGPVRRFFAVTLPMLKPVLMPALVLGTIWTFNNLNVMWLVTDQGLPADKSHILVTYVYKAAFFYYRYGYAAAFSVFIFLVLLVIVRGYDRVARQEAY